MKNIRKQIFAGIMLVLLLIISSCRFFSSFENETDKISIDSLSMNCESIEIKVGAMEYVSVSIKPVSSQKDVKLTWSYDENIIDCDTSSSWGITIKGLAEGNTSLKCSYGGYDCTCMVTVSGFEETYEEVTEPYIYSNFTILQMTPGASEKVFVSLYGGDVSDLDGYSWTTDNPSVASIQSTGQYCMVTAVEAGYARIKITHSKAAYPYYIGIYVFQDAENISYITTSDNIVTMNQEDGEKTVSVSLVNGKDTSKDSDFSWKIMTEDGETSPVSVSENGSSAVITPLKGGSCTVRITHPDSTYPLDILCRVITVIKNVYINPSSTVVTLEEDNTATVVSVLEGLSDGEYDPSAFTYSLDNQSAAEIVSTVGNQITLKGKANGSCKLLISHDKAEYDREVLVIVTGQKEDAVDASFYITTSGNYIRTKVGEKGQTVSISLRGGDEGDEADFKWTVRSTAKDGSGNDVINLETADGIFISSRAVSYTYAYGSAYIEPLCEGTAVISITHPKSAYPTEILVKVLPEEAVLEEQYYFTGSGLIKLLNGDSAQYTLTLRGSGKTDADDQNISWSCDNSVLKVTGNSNAALIDAPAAGSGCTTSKITVTHPKVDVPKTVLVLTADDSTILESMKVLYSDKSSYTVECGKTVSVSVNEEGFDDGYDFSSIEWTAENQSVIKAEKSSFNPLLCKVTALKTGLTYLKASIDGVETEFSITVLPEGAVATDPEVYFSTSQNVVSFDSTGLSQTVSVSAVNLSSSDYSSITWISENESIASVISNGTTALVTAQNEGDTIINVSHPSSANTLKIYVHVGEEYITAEKREEARIIAPDVLAITLGENEKTLSAELGNFHGNDPSGFRFECSDNDIAVIMSQSKDGNCIVHPVSKGFAEITITHSRFSSSRTVLVAVGSTEEEISEMLSQNKYFTVKNNVVNFDSAGQKTRLSVTAVNMDENDKQNIVWNSDNQEVCTVTGDGTSALIESMSEGKAVITATHADSLNSISFYIFVNSSSRTTEDCIVYISCQDVMTLVNGESQTLLSAVLVNYNGTDVPGFSFEIDSSTVAEITAQSESGSAYVKPVSAGQAEITVRNSAAEVSKKVLVVVENSEEELSDAVYLSTSSNVIAVGEGNTKTVSVSIKNAKEPVLDGYQWYSSNPAVVDVTSGGASAVITGNSTGTALITVKNSSCKYPLTIIAQCVDPVAAGENPYIQLTSSVLTLNVGSDYTSVSADLIGGTEDDYSDFVWSVKDSSICAVYGQNEVGKIRALKAGQTYVTVSHKKAVYSAQILIVCDEEKESECYISVPSSIITMKPNASSQTITASLINGTSTDKYNFTWSLDVYDIIDFQYSANVCTITPKQTGSVTITISHPKAAYSQQVIVNIQEYSNFAFPEDSSTLTQGTVSFFNMEVPVTSVKTHIQYSVDNKNICSISGTNAVAQITGIKAGTTTVRAKLVATSTNVVQAESEMLVYVKEAPVNTVYITSSSTIYTVTKGKSQSLSASLNGNGVTAVDQNNLKWTTKDTDIISITGISTSGTVTGSSIYVTAKKSGEALITCSHDKASSDLQFYIVVPGTAEKSVTLNKTYISLTKGSSGTTIKATIENPESNQDYSTLEWSADKVNGSEIVRILGSGQTVTVYPVKTGQTKVNVQLPDSGKKAECTVLVEAGKSLSFEAASRKVQPCHSVTVKYNVSPPDAALTWNTAQEEDYFSYRDLGCDENGNGSVEITGLKEGNGTLACVTDGSAKGTISVKVDWAYDFEINTMKISGSPENTYTVEYTVNPANAKIEISGNGLSAFSIKGSSGSGKITITPYSEGTDTIVIKAKNPDDNNAEFGSYSVAGTYYYDTLHTSCKVLSDVAAADSSKTAYWSNIKNETITLGDGEKLSFSFAVTEKKTKDLNISAKLRSGSDTDIVLEGSDGKYTLSHASDVTKPAYQITEGYAPLYMNSRYYPDGTPVSVSDFESETKNTSESFKDWTNAVHYNVHYNRTGWWYLKNPYTSSVVCSFTSGSIHEKTENVLLEDKSENIILWDKVRDTSLDGKCFSVEDFQNCLWYYIPYFDVQMGGTCTSHLVHPYGEINTDHIKAKYYDITPDTSVVKSEIVDTLEVTVSHNGKSTKISYPVYLETRNSACTSK